MTGGLDALESIGKKTMEVLSEGDPGMALHIVGSLCIHTYLFRLDQKESHVGCGPFLYPLPAAEGGKV